MQSACLVFSNQIQVLIFSFAETEHLVVYLLIFDQSSNILQYALAWR
jgi:hypothetical protein